MNRIKKLMYTSVSSIIYQFITVIYGLLLPRITIAAFGSEVNGLVSSISQFLSFISLAEFGVGAVVTSSFYEPLANKDEEQISRIFVSSDSFFKKIAYGLVGYTIILIIIYPLIVNTSFGFRYLAVLIAIMAISSFAQYYIGMTYRLLLSADQLAFVYFLAQSIVLILNLFFSLVFIKIGFGIHIVKLGTSLLFLIQPLVYYYIGKKKYNIDKNIKISEEPIKQKWNGIAQHVANVVVNNTDIALLTLFASLKEVSIYSVYSMVVTGIKQIILALSTGMQALLGNLMASRANNELIECFDFIEWFVHSFVAVFFGITSVLILPFVSVYMRGITDANYMVPLFAYVITLATATYCIRIPYQMMVNAAGHFKETQNSAIYEAIINIVVSILLVFKFGLVGVAIGTLCAMTYKTLYLVNYLKYKIINRKINYFVKYIMVDITIIVISWVIIFLNNAIFDMTVNSYFQWTVLAVKVSIVFLGLFTLISAVFFRDKLAILKMRFNKK